MPLDEACKKLLFVVCYEFLFSERNTKVCHFIYVDYSEMTDVSKNVGTRRNNMEFIKSRPYEIHWPMR